MVRRLTDVTIRGQSPPKTRRQEAKKPRRQEALQGKALQSQEAKKPKALKNAKQTERTASGQQATEQP